MLIWVRLTPRGSKDEVGGIETLSDGRTVLKVRVRAVPSEGEANAALLKTLAQALRVPLLSVELASGATSRLKRIAVSGDPAELVPRLEKLANVR